MILLALSAAALPASTTLRSASLSGYAVHLRPGFIAHNRESGGYALTDSGHAALAAIFEEAGLK